MTMRDRHAWRDPTAYEWTAGDIVFGWLVGAGLLLAGSVVVGVLMAGSAAIIVVILAAIIGLPTLTLYGVPAALAASFALRRVEHELVHVSVFALLGALGGGLAALLAAEPIGSGWWIATPMILVGAVTAALARTLAHDRAVRTRGQ